MSSVGTGNDKVGAVADTVWKTALASLAGLVLASACSGGGGSEGGSQPPGRPAGGALPQPPPPASMVDTPADAVRFLQRATFGPAPAEIDALSGADAADWFRREIAKPPSRFLPPLVARAEAGEAIGRDDPSNAVYRAFIEADDQLRMRMMFALSQILVVSDNEGLRGRPLTMAAYHDILSRNAFGNYRDLLEEVTYSVAMGDYLTYLRNRKGDEATGRMPDENYAREIMQLFTIGLVELDRDGTPRQDAQGREVPTYDNEDVTGLSRVFTGLAYRGASRLGRNDFPDEARYSPMQVFPEEHSPLAKSFLGTTIPEATTAEDSIDAALDTLVNHPSAAPFLARQLIQRFTLSNPAPDYVERVATAFETGRYTLPDGEAVGAGLRGDLAATLAAVLFDPDIIELGAERGPQSGKVREPVVRFVNWARAFNVDDPLVANENWLRDTSGTDRLSQHPFRSPSVFNFYRPGFVAPNTATGEAGLTAPELQIVNESSFSGYVGFMTRFIRDTSPVRDRETASFTPDYSAALALADMPGDLIDHLDLLLTGNRLDEGTRDMIADAIGAIALPVDAQDLEGIALARERRVHLAVLMVVTSPQYMTQP